MVCALLLTGRVAAGDVNILQSPAEYHVRLMVITVAVSDIGHRTPEPTAPDHRRRSNRHLHSLSDSNLLTW